MLLLLSLQVVSGCDPRTAARQASLPFTISQSLLKPMSIELVMPSNHLILCRPLLPLPSIFPSIRVFSNESVLRIRWPKYWSLSISPSSEYSGLIFFGVGWVDLLASKGIRCVGCLLSHLQRQASVRRSSGVWHQVCRLFALSVTASGQRQAERRGLISGVSAVCSLTYSVRPASGGAAGSAWFRPMALGFSLCYASQLPLLEVGL